MNNKLSFKEYWKSKEILKEAGNKSIAYSKVYKLNKYCKIPIIENNKRDYINFKPKDLVEIHWEYDINLKTTQLVKFCIINESGTVQKSVIWSSKKLVEWVNSSTFEAPFL